MTRLGHGPVARMAWSAHIPQILPDIRRSLTVRHLQQVGCGRGSGQDERAVQAAANRSGDVCVEAVADHEGAPRFGAADRLLEQPRLLFADHSWLPTCCGRDRGHQCAISRRESAFLRHRDVGVGGRPRYAPASAYAPSASWFQSTFGAQPWNTARGFSSADLTGRSPASYSAVSSERPRQRGPDLPRTARRPAPAPRPRPRSQPPSRSPTRPAIGEARRPRRVCGRHCS